ncbi:hypothetical protein HAX54_045329 [Datura stramonium]|uniref:Uncharacterized protein n=1 Tax=Datura stramonium TaxID=4076 RepID=A0ABS8SQS7_DATST|nr:hypothetical protein [Datura stramonium]
MTQIKRPTHGVVDMDFILGVDGYNLDIVDSKVQSDGSTVGTNMKMGMTVTVTLFSIVFLFILSSSYKFVRIWVALTIYMSLGALVDFWRKRTGTGPWKFLKS